MTDISLAAADPIDRFWRSDDGLRLHARDYAAATGPARLPVLCLHGLTRNARDFDAFAPLVAARSRRVLAIDVRGRGASDRDPEARYGLPVYARDVIALAEGLGIARAVLVGTSMGGLVAMELAAAAPGLVAAALVNDVGPELDPRGLARIAGYVGAAPSLDSWDEAAAYVAAQNMAALPHFGPDDWRRMARRMFVAEGTRIVPDYDPGIARPFAGGAMPADPWSRWRALATDRPVLVLRGQLSDLLAPGTARRMAAAGRNVRLVEVAGVGHAPMLDEPDALAAALQFLDEVP